MTYTTRYNQCFWLTIDGLEQHYERAEVDGTRSEFKTRNISALTLDREGNPTIDGQKPGHGRSFIKENGKWRTGTLKGLRKRHGLQGPIDDAFMDAFITMDAPDKVGAEWDKWMRGDLPKATSPAKGKNLVLFGDPQSNAISAASMTSCRFAGLARTLWSESSASLPATIRSPWCTRILPTRITTLCSIAG